MLVLKAQGRHVMWFRCFSRQKITSRDGCFLLIQLPGMIWEKLTDRHHLLALAGALGSKGAVGCGVPFLPPLGMWDPPFQRLGFKTNQTPSVLYHFLTNSQGFRKRAEDCFESTVSEGENFLSSGANSVGSAKTRWVRYGTQIKCREELTHISSRNSERAKKLTEFSVSSRSLRTVFGPSPRNALLFGPLC